MRISIDDDAKTIGLRDYRGKPIRFSIGQALIDLVELDKAALNSSLFLDSFATAKKARDKGFVKEADEAMQDFLNIIGKIHIYFASMSPSSEVYMFDSFYKTTLKKDFDFIFNIEKNVFSLKDIVSLFLDCDSNEKIITLNIPQKLYLLELYWTTCFGEPSIMTSFSAFPRNMDVVNDHTSLIALDHISELVDKIKDESFFSTQCFNGSIIDACYIEIVKMITLDISVRKCRNCGKYFVMTGRSDTEYCDRIAPGYTDKSCKDVGPLKDYAERINSNPLLLAYQKEYKAKHAQLRKITNPKRYGEEKERLKQWRIAAKASAEKNEILEEFKKWLK